MVLLCLGNHVLSCVYPFRFTLYSIVKTAYQVLRSSLTPFAWVCVKRLNRNVSRVFVPKLETAQRPPTFCSYYLVMEYWWFSFFCYDTYYPFKTVQFLFNVIEFIGIHWFVFTLSKVWCLLMSKFFSWGDAPKNLLNIDKNWCVSS